MEVTARKTSGGCRVLMVAPGSITLLAPAGMDATVASLARYFETDCERTLGASKFALTDPPDLPVKVSDRIELAVCGAHMSGLPLNAQLTDLGATFVREAKTASKYHFYALAGGPPARPGLIRSEEANAASIVLEIWSIPQSQVGALLEQIPAPLGVGSIELSDNSWVKGFLCEKSGIEGATDISHFGNWRKFLDEVA